MGGHEQEAGTASHQATLETRARETGTRRGASGGTEEERTASWRQATGPPTHPEVGQGPGSEAKEWGTFAWEKRVRRTKESRNQPKKTCRV